MNRTITYATCSCTQPHTRAARPTLPDSYSCMICGFSLIVFASCACVSFLASRADMICFFSSEDTVSSAHQTSVQSVVSVVA